MSEEDKDLKLDRPSPENKPVKKETKKPAAVKKASDKGKHVKVGGLIVLLVIFLSLAWYLAADRYTPCTTQARVQGYIVGVAPKVGGIVTHVWIGNNELVEKGQKLFQIDTSQYKIALDRARSDLQNAQSQVNAGSAAVKAARASLLAAQANADRAEKDYERQKRLYEDDPGTISVRRLESALAAVEAARASVIAAEANIQMVIEQKGGEDEKNNAILKTAATAVAKAELDLDNTTVVASESGIVTDLRANVGLFAGTGAPVLTIVSRNDVWISAEFTENNLGHLRADSPVEILFDVMPGKVYSGKVRSIGIGVNAGQVPPAGTLPSISNNRDWLRQSQRFPVIIGFSPLKHEDLLEHLRIGGQATVICYPEQRPILNFLGRMYIRMMSLFSYAY